MDDFSHILVELVEQECKSDERWTKYYHLQNPRTTECRKIVVLTVQEHLSRKNDTEIVSFDIWIEVLEYNARENTVKIGTKPRNQIC